MTTSSKVAFITGANRGLGFETARELGEAGVTVILGVRDPKKGAVAAESLRQKGITAESIPFDSLKPETFESARAYFEKNHGKLDILVNNAGVFLETPFTPSATSVTPEILRATFETNYFSVVALTLNGTPGSPIDGATTLAYNSSKTALNAFTVLLARELRDTKIKVNSAHPGWVKTDMGGPDAHLEVSEGGKTSAQLALLGEDGPTGGYFHLGEPLPW